MAIDAGLLLLRVVVGLLFAGHGAQKLFGWFGGYGLDGTSGWLASIGFKPARTWGLLAGLSEFGGGLLLALGLFTPLGALALIGAMLIAIFKVHVKNGVWVTQGGYEYNLVLLVVSAVVGFAGPGRYALDSLLGLALPPALFWIGLVITLAVVGVALVRSNQGEPAAQNQQASA